MVEWNKMMLDNDLYLLLEFLNEISERQCTRIFIINQDEEEIPIKVNNLLSFEFLNSVGIKFI